MTGRRFVVGDVPMSASQFAAVEDLFRMTEGGAFGFKISVTGADVVRVARTFTEDKGAGRAAVRYRNQGRSRDGVDCIGLPVCVRAELGLAAFDAEPGYATTSTGSEMLDYCKANMVEVSRDEMRPGDILVQMSGVVRHMAIVCDYPPCPDSLGIIHAWIRNRRVCECRLTDEFMATVRGCFRFPEVTE